MNRTILVILCSLLAVGAGASDWGGHYGTIRLVFDPVNLDAVAEVEALPQVGVLVDLYAVLWDLEDCAFAGEALNTVGGYELKLVVEGAPWKVLSQTLPEKNFNAATEPGTVQCGVFPGVNFVDGPAQLVHWQLLIEGDARNVVFRLDPAGARSCATVPDCADSGTYAIWAGTSSAKQHGLLLSAGYMPAYLNWDGEFPPLEAVHGTGTWQERGFIKAR